MGYIELFEGTTVASGLVYAFRNLEALGINYRFYTRSSLLGEDSFVYRSSQLRIFRFMPAGNSLFGGFVNTVPDECDLFITSDRKLMYEVLKKCPVVYAGKYDSNINNIEYLYQMDAFSQLPMLVNDIRLNIAV